MGTAVDPAGRLCLVTGASGLLGSRVARRLAAEGARVRALVRQSGPLYGLGRVPLEPVLGDLTDAEAVLRAAAGAAVIVHCAGALASHPERAHQVNVGGTRNLLEAGLAMGCERFVFVSTAAVYDAQGRTRLDEGTPLVTGGENLYAASKVEAECLVKAAGEQGLGVTILRPPAILGAHPSSYWGTYEINQIRGGSIARGWSSAFAYVHVENMAEAVLLALRSPHAEGEVFNIVDGHVGTLEYNNEIRGWLGMPPLQKLNAPAVEMDGTRAASVLGYAPRATYAEAMAEMRQFLAAEGECGPA